MRQEEMGSRSATPPLWRARMRGRRASGRRPARTAIPHVPLVIATVAILAPFVWVLLSSLKPLPEFYGSPSLLPKHLTLDHYRYAFGNFPLLWHFYGNSVVVTTSSVILTGAIATLAGYAFARLRSRTSAVLFAIMVVSLYFPTQLTSTFALYELTAAMRLFDTYLGLILPYTSLYLPMYIFIMRTVFRQLPEELADAASIDGASTLQVFWRVMLPLARPGIVVVVILSFTHAWGEYLWARTLTSDAALTLGVGMNLIQTNMGGTELPIMAAAYTVAIVPPVILFVLLQRWFMRSLTQGALKF